MAGNRRVWWRATERFVTGYGGMGGDGGVGGRQMASRMTKEKGKTTKDKKEAGRQWRK